MCLTAIFAYLAVGLCFLDPNLATIEISGHSAYDVFKTILIVLPILALVICCLASAMDIYIDNKSARIRNKMQKELRKALATKKKNGGRRRSRQPASRLLECYTAGEIIKEHQLQACDPNGTRTPGTLI